MTTQVQPPVAVTPPLPTRRNAELLLLCFAAVVTVAALLIVEANQERGLRWDLIRYGLAFLAVFGGAHLVIRRFAPYTDPLLLPIVARYWCVRRAQLQGACRCLDHFLGRHDEQSGARFQHQAGDLPGICARRHGDIFEPPAQVSLGIRHRGAQKRRQAYAS